MSVQDGHELIRPVTASAADLPCALYKDHGSATPVITQGHHIYPVYLQNRKYGKIVDPSLMYLCGNCHDSIHTWLYWLMDERKMPTAPVPPRAKQQAQVAYDWFMDPAA